MKDTDLKRNASGYYDEPCYKAVTAPPRPGEVWRKAKTGEYMLCIGGNKKVSSCMKLNEQQMHPEWIPVIVKDKTMYTDPLLIGYTFNGGLAECVYTIKDAQLECIRQDVGKALGITDTISQSVVALGERIAVLQDKNNELQHINADLRKEAEILKIDIVDARKIYNEQAKKYTNMSAELDKAMIYKEMYLNLIDKLVSVRGGAVAND